MDAKTGSFWGKLLELKINEGLKQVALGGIGVPRDLAMEDNLESTCIEAGHERAVCGSQFDEHDLALAIGLTE